MEENDNFSTNESKADVDVKTTEQQIAPQTKQETTYYGAEDTLITIAIINLVAGVILGIALMCSGGGLSLMIGTVVMIVGVIGWAALRVFANISKTLKKINSKLK